MYHLRWHSMPSMSLVMMLPLHLTHWTTEEMPSSSIKVLRRLVQHYSRFALHFGPPANGTPRSQRASTCHCWRHGWHQGLLQVLESCWLDPRSSCHTPNELNGKALWDFEKLRWHAHCFGKFRTEQSKLLCTSNRHTHTHTQYNCITFPDKNYPPRWMTSEDSNRCRFYQRGHLVLLLLQGICRTASSCRSNTTSRAGRKGAAKFNLPHCGYLGWDHWSHSLEHTYQWSLYSRTWDLRFPRSPPRLFFWILLHTDYEILQDISGTVWRVFEGMLSHMLSLDLQSIYNIFSSSIFKFCWPVCSPFVFIFPCWQRQKKPLHIFSWQKFLLDGKANPRLDIVVQTINHCSVNVVHFAIVFLAIFLCYAFAGHFLLGHKNKGWDSMLGSLFMLWSTELSMADVFDFSVPVQAVCYFWSFSYQILVQQVMLNMLYCIVFDSYAFVKTRAGAPLTLYAQIRDAAATARETRGFVNLYTLIVQLEDLSNVRGKRHTPFVAQPVFVWVPGDSIGVSACYPPVSPGYANDFDPGRWFSGASQRGGHSKITETCFWTWWNDQSQCWSWASKGSLVVAEKLRSWRFFGSWKLSYWKANLPNAAQKRSGNLPLIQPNHVRTWTSLKAVSGPTLCTIFQSPLHSWRFLETRMLIEMTLASGIPADEDSRLRAREVGRDWAITVGCDSCNRWESWEQFWWTKLCHFLWTLL